MMGIGIIPQSDGELLPPNLLKSEWWRRPL